MQIGALATGFFEIGAAGRALLSTEPSGDAWTVLEGGDCLTVVLADGVGHGHPANKSATAALKSIRATFEREPMTPLDKALQACHVALRGMRGAAVGICRFDPTRANASYCGVGNTAFLRHPNRIGLGVSLPGIVGWKMRSLRVFDTSLVVGDLFAFHTDGVSGSFLPANYATLPVQEAADRVLKEHGKLTDDGAVVLVRYQPR